MYAALADTLIAVGLITPEPDRADRKGVISIRIAGLHKLLESTERLGLYYSVKLIEVEQSLLFTHSKYFVTLLNDRFRSRTTSLYQSNIYQKQIVVFFSLIM